MAVVGIATVFSAGCTRLIQGRDTQPRIVKAIAVEEKPPDAEITPEKEIENPSVRQALEGVCESEERSTGVRVTGVDVEAVAEEFQGLPHYTASGESEYDSGHYVECDGQYVVLELLIED